jgi:hypothetical protein
MLSAYDRDTWLLAIAGLVVLAAAVRYLRRPRGV